MTNSSPSATKNCQNVFFNTPVGEENWHSLNLKKLLQTQPQELQVIMDSNAF